MPAFEASAGMVWEQDWIIEGVERTLSELTSLSAEESTDLAAASPMSALDIA